ncbi:hypothetical protein ECC02_001385 [Trypanosoma cruzi]|uniref:Uncharacterized protein n=1 Tax=Trypanosoma cruzi TaxID=5693 RepID=A0A7J6YFU8_TRYCR|nr:hypothetical protein ECC02_001385 [Trypanosoma cruzi]
MFLFLFFAFCQSKEGSGIKNKNKKEKGAREGVCGALSVTVAAYLLMNADGGTDETTARLVSRLAQRSTLSSDAEPFIPSFLRALATTTETQQKNGEENAVELKRGEVLETGLKQLYCNAETYTQLPSVESLATTAAVASTALCTFGSMTEEQLQELEEYLWNPSQNNNESFQDDERVFANDDDGMDPEEEEWLFKQMLEAAGVTQIEETTTDEIGGS